MADVGGKIISKTSWQQQFHGRMTDAVKNRSTKGASATAPCGRIHFMKRERQSKTVVREEVKQASPRECRLFRIEGRVQGVWFRESTRREAERLGITGYAKNMQDGSVEVLACGDPDPLDVLSKWLEEGPPMARVSGAEWTTTRRQCPGSFETL